MPNQPLRFLITSLTFISMLGLAPLGPAAGKCLRDKVPVKHTSATGQLGVVAEVNGAPMEMILDTGSEGCFFTRSQLTQAGVHVKEKKDAGAVIGVGGAAQLSSAVISLKLGDITKRITAYIFDDSPATGEQVSAPSLPILGQSFLGDLKYEISTDSICLHPTESAEDKPIAKVPFTRVGKNIVLTVNVNGHECPMVLDTGATLVSFTASQLAKVGLHAPEEASSVGFSGVGGERQSRLIVLEKVKIGALEKPGVITSVDSDESMELPLLGRSFLIGLRYRVDPKSRTVQFFSQSPP